MGSQVPRIMKKGNTFETQEALTQHNLSNSTVKTSNLTAWNVLECPQTATTLSTAMFNTQLNSKHKN